MQDTDAYKEDWLGMKTLDEAGKLTYLSFHGNHMQVPHDMWVNDLLPLLGTKLADIPAEERHEHDGEHTIKASTLQQAQQTQPQPVLFM